MSTSATEKREAKASRKALLGYAAAAVFCALFGLIYEHFSFGVYSNYMLFAFLIPLLGGFLPALFLPANATRADRKARQFYRAGIATFTVGSLFRGVLDIYGTESRLCTVYAVSGAILAAIAVLLFLIGRVRGRSTREVSEAG